MVARKIKEVLPAEWRRTKQKGIRISYKMINKAFIGACIISLIVLGYLHLFI